MWSVMQRYCNHSAFNGYHRTASAYSTVTCYGCGATWRTKARYVAGLPDWDRTKDDLATRARGER